MNIDSDLVALAATQLGGLAIVWARLEHRLTKLEVNQDWLHKHAGIPPQGVIAEDGVTAAHRLGAP